MSDSVEAALRTLGVRCRVERLGALAVVRPVSGEWGLETADVRRQALAVLRAHGFTHGALEVPGDDGDPAAAHGGASE